MSKKTVQSIEGCGAFVLCASSSCGGTFVNCVRCPAMSVTTSRMFVTVMGGSSNCALQLSDCGSRSRGLVRYQNRYVGAYGFANPFQRVADRSVRITYSR